METSPRLAGQRLLLHDVRASRHADSVTPNASTTGRLRRLLRPTTSPSPSRSARTSRRTGSHPADELTPNKRDPLVAAKAWPPPEMRAPLDHQHLQPHPRPRLFLHRRGLRQLRRRRPARSQSIPPENACSPTPSTRPSASLQRGPAWHLASRLSITAAKGILQLHRRHDRHGDHLRRAQMQPPTRAASSSSTRSTSSHA